MSVDVDADREESREQLVADVVRRWSIPSREARRMLDGDRRDPARVDVARSVT